MCLIENSQCLKSVFQFWRVSFVSAPLLAMLRVYSLFCTQTSLLAGFKEPSRGARDRIEVGSLQGKYCISRSIRCT